MCVNVVKCCGKVECRVQASQMSSIILYHVCLCASQEKGQLVR